MRKAKDLVFHFLLCFHFLYWHIRKWKWTNWQKVKGENLATEAGGLVFHFLPYFHYLLHFHLKWETWPHRQVIGFRLGSLVSGYRGPPVRGPSSFCEPDLKYVKMYFLSSATNFIPTLIKIMTSKRHKECGQKNQGTQKNAHLRHSSLGLHQYAQHAKCKLTKMCIYEAGLWIGSNIH